MSISSSGGAPPAEDSLPINLRYAEPYPAPIDMAAIIGAGRRLRRRRRAAVGTGTIAAIGAVTAIALGAGARHGGVQDIPAAGLRHATILPAFPPVGDVSVLGTYPESRPAGLSAVAWISTNANLCYGAADVTNTRVGPSVSCSGPPPSELLTPGPVRLLAGWPVFTPIPNKPGSFLAIGFLHGSADAVRVTANGATVTARVIPLETGTAELAGGYALWLPARADGSIHSSDITSIVALDAAGHVIAQGR